MDSEKKPKREEDFIDVEELDNTPGPSTRPQRSSSRRISTNTLTCQYCDFVASVQAEMSYHLRMDHANEQKNTRTIKKKPESVPVVPTRKRGRPRKYDTGVDHTPTITTKQLIGERVKRNSVDLEKYVAKEDDEVDPRISVLQERGIVTEDTLVGEYLYEKSAQNYEEPECSNEPNEEMEVEIETNEEDLIEKHRSLVEERVNNYRVDIRSIGENKKKYTRRMGAPRKPKTFGPKVYDTKNIPFRLRVGDVNGKYACYAQKCEWKGAYRSLRMEHMRAIHPEWKMPSRYLLQRISKDGVYIDPDNYIPPIACLIPGCDWRGNFRASRSAHMKSRHPEEHAEIKKKREQGSHQPAGPYLCHLPECDWRGASRSTRAKHMKQEHPSWSISSYKKLALFECFACGVQLSMISGLINHIHHNHGLGLMVDLTFETREEFTDWIATIERIYHIQFFRRSALRQGQDFLKFQLVCSCTSTVSPKSMKMVANLRNAAYSMGFLRKRPDRIMTRRKIDCCLYLDVKEECRLGRISVSGCIEHTGHYWGMPLIRPSILDRQVYQMYMNWRNTHNMQMPMHLLIDTLNETEGFRIDDLVPDVEVSDIEYLDEDDLISLFEIIKTDSMRNCIFSESRWDVECPSGEKKQGFGLGYMCPKMKELWQNYGAGRIAIVESVGLILENYTLNIFYVIVYTEDISPRCCCLYLTTDFEKGHHEILSALSISDSRAPRTLVVDPSQVWVNESVKVFPSEPVDLQISEWTLLDYWATMVEQFIDGDMDQFYVMCALRRLLRICDYQQFLCFIVELFEALFELEYHEFAKFFDTQLSDIAFFKRWSPLHRNELTSHNNPTFALSVRYFRERFLGSFGVTRVDEYFAHVIQRTENYNSFVCSDTYTLRPLDPIRRVMYPTTSALNEIEKPAGLGRLARPANSYHEAEEYEQILEEHEDMGPVYHELDIGATEEVAEGMHSVVDEVILDVKGNEIVDVEVEDTLMDQNVKEHSMMVVDEIVGMDDTVIEHEEIVGDLSVGHNVIIEDGPSSSAATCVDYEMRHPLFITEKQYEAIDVDISDSEQFLEDGAHPSSETVHPKRETTKSVIGERRKNRPRIAGALNVSNLDEESIREIATRLIEIDGRKTQRVESPFMRSSRLRDTRGTVQVIEEEPVTERY